MADDGDIGCRVFLQNLCEFAQGSLCLVAQCCGVEAEKNTCRKGYFDSWQAVGIRHLLHLGAFNLGSFGSLLVHLVSDGNAGTRTYCSTYRSSNGCPLAFTYQSADNGTCCCTGATADYSTFGLVVHCAATAQQQCAAQK